MPAVNRLSNIFRPCLSPFTIHKLFSKSKRYLLKAITTSAGSVCKSACVQAIIFPSASFKPCKIPYP